MAGLYSAGDVVATGMQAQGIRMATVSSNLANINTAASSEDGAFKALMPEFRTLELGGDKGEAVGVTVNEIKRSEAPVRMAYDPSHPLANEEGYVFFSNVSREESIADMTSASESYKANLAAAGLINELISQTIKAME